MQTKAESDCGAPGHGAAHFMLVLKHQGVALKMEENPLRFQSQRSNCVAAQSMLAAFQILTQRVRVPRAARTRFESDTGARHARRGRCDVRNIIRVIRNQPMSKEGLDDSRCRVRCRCRP